MGQPPSRATDYLASDHLYQFVAGGLRYVPAERRWYQHETPGCFRSYGREAVVSALEQMLASGTEPESEPEKTRVRGYASLSLRDKYRWWTNIHCLTSLLEEQTQWHDQPHQYDALPGLLTPAGVVDSGGEIRPAERWQRWSRCAATPALLPWETTPYREWEARLPEPGPLRAFLSAALWREDGPRLLYPKLRPLPSLWGLLPVLQAGWGDYVALLPAGEWRRWPEGLSPQTAARLRGVRLVFLGPEERWEKRHLGALLRLLMLPTVEYHGRDGGSHTLTMPRHFILPEPFALERLYPELIAAAVSVGEMP